MTIKREIELSEELADFIEERSRQSGDAVDVIVQQAISSLKDHDQIIDGWMQRDVIPSYDQWVEAGKPTKSESEVLAFVAAAIAEASRRKAS